MFERFTESARRALFFARYEVTQLGGATIEAEHLVLGVVRATPSAIPRFANVGEAALRRQLEAAARLPDTVGTSVEIPFSREAKAVLEQARVEADALENHWIRPEHLVLGVVVKTSGAAARALRDAGVAPDAIREYLRQTPEDAGDRPDGSFALDGLIARVWKGVARPDAADAYVAHLERETFPALARLDGFVHAGILRREVEDGTEFQIQTIWRSLDAIKAFAGDDAEAAVVPPAAQALLVRYDRRAVHYHVVNPKGSHR